MKGIEANISIHSLTRKLLGLSNVLLSLSIDLTRGIVEMYGVSYYTEETAAAMIIKCSKVFCNL